MGHMTDGGQMPRLPKADDELPPSTPGAVDYRVRVTHWEDGDIDVHVSDVGHSQSDRASVAFALRQAADMVEQGDPAVMNH